MKLGIKLNLQKVLDDIATFTDGFDITFDNISNLTGWSDDHAPFIAEDVTKLNFFGDIQDIYLLVFNEETDEELAGDTITDVTENGSSISFQCVIDDREIEQILYFFDKGYIELDQFGKTNMIAYRLNDERHKLNKNLTPVTILEGKFTAPLGIKSLELDVVNYNLDNSYNYIYIPKLKRYYYVTNIQLTTKDYTKLILQEDVLMSWATLIKSQSAYVTRYGGASNSLLVDERYPVKDEAEIDYFIPSMTTGVTVVPFKYIADATGLTKYPTVILKSSSDIITFLVQDNVIAPTGSGLPNIENKRANSDHIYLLTLSEYGAVVRACLGNDAPATYIHSVMLLPFELQNVFPNSSMRNSRLMSGTKTLGNVEGGIGWKNHADVIDTDPYFPETNLGSIPYIVVADFTFNALSNITLEYNYRDYTPFTLWEIYIPFVGWVSLDPVNVLNKRIMVYFTFDIDTGLSTCYIYNRTDQKVIWSGSCQLAMKLTLAVTNADELARQKQATSLNLIMGLMSSALSMGIGGSSGNAVAMVGGIMGMGKTITNAVNSYNSLIEKAQITYGSSDNALYSPNTIIVRKTTHKKLITTTAEENRYKELNGYPYKQYVALSSLTTGNYVEIGDIHFDAQSENIYQVEIEEIIALLKNGVIM